jgi:tetratricopeptide (TPR) repeat protein
VSLERIEITPFAVMVGDILQNRRTGYLTIVRPPLRKVLYWSQGELVLVTSSAPEEALADFLVRRGVIGADRTAQIMHGEPIDVVSNFHEAGILELSWRQTLLREWVATLFLPLFSLDEGTAAFTEDDAIPPDKRVFLQSSAALVIEGVRSITNGLVLRRSLGDLKREITWAHDSRYNIDSIPLTDPERTIASQLRTDPQTIESFLKQFSTDSVTAAKVVISLMSIGMYGIVEIRPEEQPATANFDEMQRDLELLAAIGASDQRSLRAVALSRQMAAMDHYQMLDVPRAATRAQIMSQADDQKRKFDPVSYPPIVRDAALAIIRRIDEAVNVLKDANRRAEYDKLLADRSARSSGGSINQRLTQRSIADQNFTKARELAVQGDYYGAIVLLKQAVEFSPDNAQAWYLLGSCQERNPKWRRDAAESYQMALSVDPNFIDAMISLGDVYKLEGMISRAQTCYEDVLRIAPENQQARSRVQGLKRR